MISLSTSGTKILVKNFRAAIEIPIYLENGGRGDILV